MPSMYVKSIVLCRNHKLSLLPHVTPCSLLLPLLSLVTPCYPLLPHFTPCYPLLAHFTPCYPCYPMLPQVTQENNQLLM